MLIDPVLGAARAAVLTADTFRLAVPLKLRSMAVTVSAWLMSSVASLRWSRF
jgi:hypothetical protein